MRTDCEAACCLHTGHRHETGASGEAFFRSGGDPSYHGDSRGC